jgi:hypothetical protein
MMMTAMSSYVTSFVGLFAHRADTALIVNRIEIPLIQRDYAQGRVDQPVTQIREHFLDAIRLATTGVEPLGLDFVYGEMTDGTLFPLDGQQRLTTLFLLHWYVASRTDHIDEVRGVVQFAYATRPGARRFCERLMQHALPPGAAPSTWITDQPWYLYVWRHDPTVQGMLVMLDAIHFHFADDDLDVAWSGLIDPEDPAISFHLLPINDMGSAEDLYIKMNSRGKQLTEFETFKAQLEKALDESPRADELAHRLDGKWADVLWPLRSSDNLFDDEYLNYIRFVIGLCEWRQGVVATSTCGDLARATEAFAPGRPGATENLNFLFAAFDTWVRADSGEVEDTDAIFADLLTAASTRTGVEEGKVVVFGDLSSNINLFKACCDTRYFSNRISLLMYAVLLHRIHASREFPPRLRVVRNLIEASTNEIRFNAMSKLVSDVGSIILDGDIEAVDAFNTSQQRDEIQKKEFLAKHPEMSEDLSFLEDHVLLRGCLMAFELDADVFAERARAFRELFGNVNLLPAVARSLLTAGDYSRSKISAGKYQFGSPTQLSRWRDLLAGDAPSRDGLSDTRLALGRLLDLTAASDLPLDQALRKVQRDWLEEREENIRFDWRYYLVKYPAMGEGQSGIYAASGPLGFSLCMLEGTALNGYYRDPFLLAVARECHAQDAVWGTIEDKPDGPWFTGSADAKRWMRLRTSGVQMMCANQGYVVQSPTDHDSPEAFRSVCIEHGLDELNGTFILTVPQTVKDGQLYDDSDRVQLGASLLSAFITAQF